VSYAKRRLWDKDRKRTWATKQKKPEKVIKTKPFGKETRQILPKGPRYYSCDPIKRPLYSRKHHHRLPKIRPTLTKGTVLILLAGRFRGRRVILLKVFKKTGLLLITGPYKVNGVPLRRVNSAYVIATSTKVELSNVKVPAHIKDAYFKRPKKAKAEKSATEFFEGKKKSPKKVLDPKRRVDQKAVDKQILPIVEKTRLLREYLKSSFSFSRHQYPHLLKF